MDTTKQEAKHHEEQRRTTPSMPPSAFVIRSLNGNDMCKIRFRGTQTNSEPAVTCSTVIISLGDAISGRRNSGVLLVGVVHSMASCPFLIDGDHFMSNLNNELFHPTMLANHARMVAHDSTLASSWLSRSKFDSWPFLIDLALFSTTFHSHPIN